MNKVSTIEELLAQLREPKNNHSNPFVDLLPEAQELLGLGSKLDAISLEALLIQAIVYRIFDSENEPDEISKEDAKKRDSYLLTMGLVDEYYHVKNDGIHYSAPLRQKDYLTNSQYIEIFYGKRIRLKELKPEEAYIKAKGALSTTDRRCREDLADYLSKPDNCQRCFEKGTLNYIRKVELYNEESKQTEIKQELILPKLRYIVEPTITEQGNELNPFPSSIEDNFNEGRNSTEKSAEHNESNGEVIEPTHGQEPNSYQLPAKDALSKDGNSIEESVKCGREFSEEATDPIHGQKSESNIAESASIVSPSIVDGDISDSNTYNYEDGNGDDEADNDEVNSQDTKTDRHSKKRWVAIVLVICLCIGGVATVSFFSKKRPTPSQESEPDLRVLGDPFHAVNGDDMEKLANEAFSSIALYDDSGEYRIYDMNDLVVNRVLENPIFGDMVARGMLEAFSKGDYDYFVDIIPNFQEFVDATDLAMNEQEDAEKRCMKKWLAKTHDIVHTTDEYKEYVEVICQLLDYNFSVDIQNLKITSYWELDPDSSVMEIRTIQRLEKRTAPALVFSYNTMSGTCRCIFGFLIEDGSFVISDPYNWGVDSFIE